jgi:hypothetical protein
MERRYARMAMGTTKDRMIIQKNKLLTVPRLSCVVLPD